MVCVCACVCVQVEVTLNGKTVDLPMIIDESGKIFFAQPRPPQVCTLLVLFTQCRVAKNK